MTPQELLIQERRVQRGHELTGEIHGLELFLITGFTKLTVDRSATHPIWYSREPHNNSVSCSLSVDEVQEALFALAHRKLSALQAELDSL